MTPERISGPFAKATLPRVYAYLAPAFAPICPLCGALTERRGVDRRACRRCRVEYRLVLDDSGWRLARSP